jgi:histidyl-tRNA synthetase
MAKPSIPKGTRDFSPTEILKRNYIFDTIKKSFVNFGFLPIETPSMEKLETLTGKYGEEGDNLIFKVLNRGDKLSKAVLKVGGNETLSQGKIEHILCAEALRYDLTVPFARYVVQHQNDIAYPFKRYQIQPVWRADRPQRGRYREFFQCDADIIGSNSLLNEVELIQLFDEVLTNLGLTDFTIKVNNRKILTGIAEITGESERIIDITVAIDKLDKIGEEGVVKELMNKEISTKAIDKIKPLFQLKGNTSVILSEMKTMLATSEIGLKGIEELTEVFNTVNGIGLSTAKLEFDVTLARGLNYYTGAIFEVKANHVNMGSICGGGRYDDLTSIFGLKDISGVGISFGADRIYDVIEELDLFPSFQSSTTQVIFLNFGADKVKLLKTLKIVRNQNIHAEYYPENSNLKKQMKYANAKGIPFVAFIGENELESGVFKLKNMKTGEEKEITLDLLVKELN